MSKIVYNAVEGVYGLSHFAMLRYAQLAGITLYPEPDGNNNQMVYWTAPYEVRISAGYLTSDHYLNIEHFPPSIAESMISISNQAFANLTLQPNSIGRDDPILIAVVEELGEGAFGQWANLQIRYLEPGTRYRIEVYENGSEAVLTPDECDWFIA